MFTPKMVLALKVVPELCYRFAHYIKITCLVVTFAVYMADILIMLTIGLIHFPLFFLVVAHTNYKVIKRNHEGYWNLQ